MSEVIKIGIDLGTTNTVVSYINRAKGKPDYLSFAGGKQYLPSVILVERDTNKVIVGEIARNKSKMQPRRFIKSAKTHMGEFGFRYPDSVSDMELDITLTPKDVAAYVLGAVKQKIIDKKLVSDNEAEIEAVITVPAYFSGNQVHDTIRAAEIAGLKVKRIISEPMAAAVAYVTEDIQDNTKIFVVDFGGGTLDLTLLRYDSRSGSYTQEAIGGDNHLGGDNIDDCLLEFLIGIIKEEDYVDFSSFEKSGLPESVYDDAIWELKREVTRIKEGLSEDDEYEIGIANLYERKNGTSYNLEYDITREEFEEVCGKVLDKFKNCINNTIINENVNLAEIDRVLLVGGSCYIPKVQEIVEEIFGKEPYEADLAKVVALGACIVANQELGELTENIAYDLGVDVEDTKSGGMRFDTLIKRNTPVPCFSEKTYTTSADNQQSVRVNVYERGGYVSYNDTSLDKCDFFGSIEFKDFQKGPAGVPQIRIRFDFDVNRRLKVTITDLLTQKVKETQLEKSKKLERSGTAAPMDIFLLLDTSASMSRTFIEVRKAVLKLVTKMIDLSVNRVGIVKFGEEKKSCIMCSLTNDSNKIISTVNNMTAFDNSTYIAKAIELAASALSDSSRDRKKIIIMLTDGYAHDSGARISSAVKAAFSKNVRIITIGAGNFDKNFLYDISSTRKGNPESYSIENMEQLTKTFETIVESLRNI